jgi:psiF repeat
MPTHPKTNKYRTLFFGCILLPLLCFAESEQSAMFTCDREAQSQGLIGDARKKFMQKCMPVARIGGSIKKQESPTAEAIRTDNDVATQDNPSPLNVLTEEQWWGPEGATKLTINGESFTFSNLLGVKRNGNSVCAMSFMSFFGEETAHIFHGNSFAGKSELVNIRRVRGRMNESPRMELYAGATHMVQRIYVGGDYEPRLFLLPKVDIPRDSSKSAELNTECSK